MNHRSNHHGGRERASERSSDLGPLPRSLGAPPGLCRARCPQDAIDRSEALVSKARSTGKRETESDRTGERREGEGRDVWGKSNDLRKSKRKKSLLRVLARACEVDHSWIDLLLSGWRGVVGVPAAAVVVRRTVVVGVVVRSILVRVVVRSAGVAFVR